MEEILIDNKENPFEEIEQEVSPVVRAELDITVTDGINYGVAAEFLMELKAAQSKVVKFFGPMKQKAHAAWKEIVASESNVLNPLKAAEDSIKNKLLYYDAEEKRKAVEEQRRLQKIADAKAEAERQRQIKAAENLKTDSLREERLEEAEEVIAPIIHVQHDTPKIRGISSRTVWKARIVNKQAFIKAGGSDQNLLGFITIDETSLNRLAQATKGQLNYPGIEFYSVRGMGARGTK